MSTLKLGKIDRETRSRRRLTPVRLLLPLGWALAAVGYFGPWIAHPTAALTLSGVDMGEFVKFLPGVLDGSLPVTRQFFYLPPWTVAVTVALLAGSRRLRYPWPLQLAFVLLALPVSLQLLVEQGGIRTMTAKAGSVVFFDCNTMHGSNSNISPWPRANVFMVYNSMENTLEPPKYGLTPRPEHIATRKAFKAVTPLDTLKLVGG